jgi:hypothetical protein
VSCVLSVLGDNLVDAYSHILYAKELRDTLDSKFGATDTVGELYTMQQFNDYKIIDNRSVVQWDRDIHIMAKKNDLPKCMLYDKFFAGCIVAKLPHSWRNFAT